MAGSQGPSPPYPAAFCLWKNFSQRINLIREIRKKRKKKSGQNNNIFVIKQNQGLLVLP